MMIIIENETAKICDPCKTLIAIDRERVLENTHTVWLPIMAVSTLVHLPTCPYHSRALVTNHLSLICWATKTLSKMGTDHCAFMYGFSQCSNLNVCVVNPRQAYSAVNHQV